MNGLLWWTVTIIYVLSGVGVIAWLISSAGWRDGVSNPWFWAAPLAFGIVYLYVARRR